MKSLIVRFVREDQGQDLIEYALLAAFLSLAAATGAALVGTNLQTWYTTVAGTIAGMNTAP
jgi:Flp pilus assembly pilin Flp